MFVKKFNKKFHQKIHQKKASKKGIKKLSKKFCHKLHHKICQKIRQKYSIHTSRKLKKAPEKQFHNSDTKELRWGKNINTNLGPLKLRSSLSGQQT